MNRIYLPMTADLFHIGHLRTIKECRKLGKVYIGLLSDKVIKRYKKKKPIFSYKEREELLGAIKYVFLVANQASLNPYKNLIKYNIDLVASGDGWEPEEIEAIKKAGCKAIDIQLKGEKKGQKLFSSSKIKQRICLQE